MTATMAHAASLPAHLIARTLGVARSADRRHATLPALRQAILRGLPYAAFERLAADYDIPRKTLLGLLRVPPRTLARRKRVRRFAADESDRLFRIGRIAAQAAGTLGSRKKASAWLLAANRALGGPAPLDLLDTDLGARQVEDLLLRIAHGVHS